MQAVGGAKEDVISHLIDTKLVRGENCTSWQSFDLQLAMLKWKQGPGHKDSLEVQLVSTSPDVSTYSHVRLMRVAELTVSQWLLERSLLVTYTLDCRMALKTQLHSKWSTHSKKKRR